MRLAPRGGRQSAVAASNRACVVRALVMLVRPTGICTTVVKKGSSARPAYFGHIRTLQSQRPHHIHERQKIPSARVSGRALPAPEKSAARRARPAQEPGAPAGARRISQDGPKNINMPGYREVFRCAQCGYVVSTRGRRRRASACGAASTCTPAPSACRSTRAAASSAWQPVPARVSPKNARNTCTQFQPAHHRGARDHDAQSGQLAEGVRRSLQFLMSLLSDRDRQTVQTHLAGLTHDVTLLFFTQTIGAPETATDRPAGRGRAGEPQRPRSRSKR